ncbi:MAG: SBBP repeat-containing protein [Gammaproteobacteria bacterium]
MSFEENRGQTGEPVRFLSRGSGYTVFLTPTEAVLALHKTTASRDKPSETPVLPGQAAGRDPESREFQAQRDWMPASAGMTQPASSGHRDQDTQPRSVLRMQLIGANPKPRISGADALPGKVNYLRGNDPKQWRTNVPTYAQVRYEHVYPGIDLVYYGNQRQLEHDFVVAPGADPKTIRLVFQGAEKLDLDAHGDLVLHLTHGTDGEVRLHKPSVYQEVNGARRAIEGRYVLHPGQRNDRPQLGFQVAAYDKTQPLVIDPVLVYSTYLGGSGGDAGSGIAVDSAGNAYVTGYTNPSNFGVLVGGFDAFVTKLNAGGSALVYSTYLGGGKSDGGFGIAIDNAGNAYITGVTYSNDFPTVNPVQGARAGRQDAFVAKLNAGGSALVYSTYLGGSGHEYALDDTMGIAVDSAGNAYVTGATYSNDFPTVNPLQGTLAGTLDAYVAKLNAGGSALIYSTYLGGSDSGYYGEFGSGIAVDSAGNAYVTGVTYSNDFPTVNPLQGARAGRQDAFVAKLDAGGSALLYSTYLGGSGSSLYYGEVGYGIAVDSAGNAYITGRTDSANFPTVNPLQGNLAGPPGYFNAFVTKLNAGGSALVYSTYLGGSGGDVGKGIAVDSAGNAYVTGVTGSHDFPTVNPLQGALVGGGDTFVAKLSAGGSALFYSTYLGGSNDGFFNADEGDGIAVDSAGNAYVTGVTSSHDFPTVNVLQGNLKGGYDAFVAKISETAPPTVYLFLHGTASDPTTWDDLVRKRFGDHCPVTELGVDITEDSECYRVEFADIPVNQIWTNGDGSKFRTLGVEVGVAIKKIEARMHPAAIILVGHSRGGLAARAYLQRIAQKPPYKLGLLTIGTPHQGTPLGRIAHWLAQEGFKLKDVPVTVLRARCLLPGMPPPAECVYKFTANLFSPTVRYQATEHDRAGKPVQTNTSAEIHALNAGARRLDDWVLTFGQIYSHNLRLGQKIIGTVNILDNDSFVGRWLVAGRFKKMRKYVLENIVSGIAKWPRHSFCVSPDKYDIDNWACNGDGVVPTISQRLIRLPGFSRGNKPLHSGILKGVSHIKETGQMLEINKILDAMSKDLW